MKYYMRCGECEEKIPVGTDKIVYRIYECDCGALNYPGQYLDDAVDPICQRKIEKEE